MVPKAVVTKGMSYGTIFIKSEEEALTVADFIHGAFRTIAEDFKVKNASRNQPVKLTVTVELDAR